MRLPKKRPLLDIVRMVRSSLPFERIADELATKYYEIITTGQSVDIESFSEEYARVNYSSYNIEFNEKMEFIVENFNQD